MKEAKFEVPAELLNVAERAIDQSEKAFGMFFDAASKSITAIPSPVSEVSKKSLSIMEENMKLGFDHARRLLHARDPQEAMKIQSEFLNSQMSAAREQTGQIAEAMAATAKDATEGKLKIGSSS